MQITSKAVALAAASFFALASCERNTDTTPAPAKQESTPAPATGLGQPRTYHVRGIIESIPDPSRPTAELMIRHEAINDFADAQGKVVGMNAMTMPFPRLAPGVSLSDLAPGDKIAFSFTVTWTSPEGRAPRPEWVVDSISKLPADTELVFGPKQVTAKPTTPEASEASPSSDPE